MEFSNKVILITGASRGIGREIAVQFSQKGANVVIHYNKNKQAANQTLEMLEAGHHIAIQANLSSASETTKLIEETTNQFGKIDVLVNNAGIFERHNISDISFDKWKDVWQRTINTNLIGPAMITHLVAQLMIKQGSGKIINISSRGAFRGEPHAPAYGASKAGLNAMSQSLAKALAPFNIYVYTITPGWVETDMSSDLLEGAEGEAIKNQSPLGRVAQPEEIAKTVIFLASEGTDYLTGAIVDINGASYLRS